MNKKSSILKRKRSKVSKDGTSYFKKETIEFYGIEFLKEISGTKHIKELEDGSDNDERNFG